MTTLVDEKTANRVRQGIHTLIKRGKLFRAPVCAGCLREAFTIPHHQDYDRPLDITWLCKSCHGKLECSAHKPKKRGRCNDGRGNRTKTERNQKIMELWQRGYRQQSIANIFKMKASAVSMVISRERKKARG